MYDQQYHLDKRNAKFLGVCAGFARYSGLSVLWVRIGFVVLTLLHCGFITIPAYFITALVANNRRDTDIWTDDDYRPRYRSFRSRY